MSFLVPSLKFLQSSHDFLAAQTDLSPANEGVNFCLNQLVTTISGWYGTPLFDALPETEAAAGLRACLPDLCGQAEGEMEKWWARHILNESCPALRALNSFWYMEHYRDLCRDEVALLSKEKSRTVAFLGSGALPLTGLIMAMEQTDCSIRCIDYDEEACTLAARLVKSLNLTEKVEIVQQRAEEFIPHPGETVIMASLLRAPDLFERLAAYGTKDLLVRDAEGAYRFLYKPAALPDQSLYTEAGRTKASATRINTSIHFQSIN